MPKVGRTKHRLISAACWRFKFRYFYINCHQVEWFISMYASLCINMFLTKEVIAEKIIAFIYQITFNYVLMMKLRKKWTFMSNESSKRFTGNKKWEQRSVATTIEITTTIEIIISIEVENAFKTKQSVAHYWKNDHYWNDFYYWNSNVLSTLL